MESEVPYSVGHRDKDNRTCKKEWESGSSIWRSAKDDPRGWDQDVSSKLPGTGKGMVFGGDLGHWKDVCEVMWSLYTTLPLQTRKLRSGVGKSWRSHSKWLTWSDLELLLCRNEKKSASQNGMELQAPLCWNPHSPPLIKDREDSRWPLLEVVVKAQKDT